MLWARLLAYVTRTVNQELLLRNEYLSAENRILRGQIKGRVLLTEGEKATLAEIAHRLGRMAPSAPVVWSLPPGEYTDVNGAKKIRTARPVIVFFEYEAWGILYSWTGNAVRKIWIAD